jgi:Concanavalin A-like lectin/glucanases superfamily
MRNKIYFSFILLATVALSTGCQKMKRPELGEFPRDTNPANGPLRFYTAFDGTSTDALRNAVDSIRANFASSNPFTTVNGISGKALQGSLTNNTAVKYAAPNDFARATSFTIAFWMKNSPAAGGAQFAFSMPKTVNKDSWTTNTETFMLIEDNSPDRNHSTADSAAVKIGIKDNWFEFLAEKRVKNLLDNNWHHLAITYDQTTSKVSFYKDGGPMAQGLPATWGDLKRGGNPYGPMDFNNVTGFAIGGWSQHISLPGPGDNPAAGGESWAKAWAGALDQFRLYNKALTAAEVQALFNSKL